MLAPIPTPLWHAEIEVEVPVEHGLLVENLLDLAHAPFTHTSTFARGWPVGGGQAGPAPQQWRARRKAEQRPAHQACLLPLCAPPAPLPASVVSWVAGPPSTAHVCACPR